MSAILHITGIAHSSLLVADLDRALRFYQDILELDPDGARPALGYPGAWLNVGSQQIHLIELSSLDPTNNRSEHPGHDRHTALYINSLASLTEILKAAAISYTLSHSGRAAVFCRDPDGNGLEFIELPERIDNDAATNKT